MGLDMYAFATPDAPATPVDFRVERAEQIAYWRKHPNLHGWMEALYREKGGRDADFNCVNLQLTAEDIDRLERDVAEGKLPETSGFFFGASHPEDADTDRAFIAEARHALAEGRAVFYTSWW